MTVIANGSFASATWEAITGTHTVKAHVDDVNRIAESDENNNVMTKQINVGTQTAPAEGDLNGDGRVDWTDVTIVADMVQGKTSPILDADLNGDGTVDWKDVALLADIFFGRASNP